MSRTMGEKIQGTIALGVVARSVAQATHDALSDGEGDGEVSVGVVLATHEQGTSCIVGDRVLVLRGMLMSVVRELELDDMIGVICEAHGASRAELIQALTARAEA